MKSEKNKEKNSITRKRVLKIIKRTLIILMLTGITISTFPSIEYDNAYENYKKNLPSIEINESRTEYASRLYEDAINSNKKLTDQEKTKLINIFNSLVINEIGDYFTDDVLIQMMAVASTQSIKELTEIEKKFSWYEGFYNKYLNQLVIDSSIDAVDDTLLAHEQLHAILRNSFYTKSYALNEVMTKKSVKGDDSYLYLNQLYDILCFTIGKEKLYNYFLTGDIDNLKNDLSKYLTIEEANQLIVSYDDIVFSHFYTSFLSRIGIAPNSKTLMDRENEETKATGLLIKLFENRFNCSLENSSLGKLLFGYYTPEIAGLTFINNKIGYYEPYCNIKYLNESTFEVTIDFLTSNIDTSSKDFYRISEKYTIDIEELGHIDLQNLIDDAKYKHHKELVEKSLDKKHTLS